MNRPFISYSVEVTEIESGITRLVPLANAWSDEYSPPTWSERMCDCNIAGYFHKGMLVTQEGKPDEWSWRTGDPHPFYAGTWLATHECDHSMPPTRVKVGAAHLSDGREVPL